MRVKTVSISEPCNRVPGGLKMHIRHLELDSGMNSDEEPLVFLEVGMTWLCFFVHRSGWAAALCTCWRAGASGWGREGRYTTQCERQ